MFKNPTNPHCQILHPNPLRMRDTTPMQTRKNMAPQISTLLPLAPATRRTDDRHRTSIVCYGFCPFWNGASPKKSQELSSIPHIWGLITSVHLWYAHLWVVHIYLDNEWMSIKCVYLYFRYSSFKLVPVALPVVLNVINLWKFVTVLWSSVICSGTHFKRTWNLSIVESII